MLDHGRALEEGWGGKVPVGRGRIHRRLRGLGESAVSSGERRGGGEYIYLHPTAIQPIAGSGEYSPPRQELFVSFLIH